MCSDEGLTLETSGFESFSGGQFTLSTRGGFLKGGITLFQEKNVPYFRDNFIPGINYVLERRNNAIKGINLG